ncbi:MAG: RHS repeat domain-containing protein [Planctomycetota bacterium]|jgi:RHS repeat-associated protein
MSGERGDIQREGNSRWFEYDLGGRMTFDNNALGNGVTYEYDKAGNRTKVTDATGNEWTYTFDNRSSITFIDYPAPLGNESMCYNSVGALMNRTDSLGQTTSYTYDCAGFLTRKTLADSSYIDYTRNARGQCTAWDGTGGAVNPDIDFTYDAVGNLLSKTNNTWGGTISYQFNTAGLNTKMTGPSGTYYDYSFDTAGRLDTVSENGSVILDVDLNALGARTCLTRKYSGSEVGHTDYTYNDDLQRLTEVSNEYSNGTPFSSFTYTLDDVGNRTKKTYLDGSYVDYVYDAAYQLCNESRTSGGETPVQLYAMGWTYDNTGNRIVQDDSVNGQTTYSYTNQILLANSSAPGSTTYDFTYNDAGDLVQEAMNTSQIIKTFGFDYDGRMDTYSDNSTSATYKNCPAALGPGGCGAGTNLRVFTNSSGTVTKYYHDGADVVAEFDSSDSLVRRYFHLGLDETAYTEIVSGDNTGSFFYFHDGLGSVTDILNTSGVRVNQYDYYAFGEDYGTPTEGISNRYKYTNRAHDIWSGMYYNRMRYLTPANGRFNQLDPVGMSDGPNVFIYARNNPVMFIDRFGTQISPISPVSISPFPSIFISWILPLAITQPIINLPTAMTFPSTYVEGDESADLPLTWRWAKQDYSLHNITSFSLVHTNKLKVFGYYYKWLYTNHKIASLVKWHGEADVTTKSPNIQFIYSFSVLDDLTHKESWESRFSRSFLTVKLKSEIDTWRADHLYCNPSTGEIMLITVGQDPSKMSRDIFINKSLNLNTNIDISNLSYPQPFAQLRVPRIIVRGNMNPISYWGAKNTVSLSFLFRLHIEPNSNRYIFSHLKQFDFTCVCYPYGLVE